MGSFLQTAPKNCFPGRRICKVRCLNLSLASAASQNLARAGCRHTLRTLSEVPGLSSLNLLILKGVIAVVVLLNTLENRINGD